MNGTGNPGLACCKRFGKHRLKKAEVAVSLGDVLLFKRVTTSILSNARNRKGKTTCVLERICETENDCDHYLTVGPADPRSVADYWSPARQFMLNMNHCSLVNHHFPLICPSMYSSWPFGSSTGWGEKERAFSRKVRFSNTHCKLSGSLQYPVQTQ